MATDSAPIVAQTNPDERTTAMLAHLLMIFSGFLPPLVIYLVRKDSRFVAFHAMQALLWQVTFFVIWIVGFGVFFISMIAYTTPSSSPAGQGNFPVGLFAGFGFIWLLAMVFWVLNLVLGIVYSLKANRGEWAEYPLFGKWARRIVHA